MCIYHVFCLQKWHRLGYLCRRLQAVKQSEWCMPFPLSMCLTRIRTDISIHNSYRPKFLHYHNDLRDVRLGIVVENLDAFTICVVVTRVHHKILAIEVFRTPNMYICVIFSFRYSIHHMLCVVLAQYFPIVNAMSLLWSPIQPTDNT